MTNETLSKLIGAALGAAIIVAGMALFGRATAPEPTLRAAETVTVVAAN